MDQFSRGCTRLDHRRVRLAFLSVDDASFVATKRCKERKRGLIKYKHHNGGRAVAR
jgi:hypothetical protein